MITITNILDCQKNLMDIDAVVFDLDDTLYSEKEYVKSGYAAIANAFPQVKNMKKRLWNAFEKKLLAIDYVLDEEGLLLPCHKAKAIEIYRNHTPSITLYPGVADMLLRLSQKKKLGLLTDGRPEGQWAKIEALGIKRYFEKIIVTDELGGTRYRKPNEEAFVIMQKAVGVPFERMLYIGDNKVKDFIAPKKLGMKSCFFANPDGLYVDR